MSFLYNRIPLFSALLIAGTGIFAAQGCSEFLLLAEKIPTPAGNFTPQHLKPHFFVESRETFTNPTTNAQCTGPEKPNYCCSGRGQGSCDQPVKSFVIVNNSTRNFDCRAAGKPHACCTGEKTGACAYEEGDNANGWKGNSYCPKPSVIGIKHDGCVQQWLDQSVFQKSGVNGHPITGSTFEQDDMEKPLYRRNCLNGHGCVLGHSGRWKEAGYSPKEQPKQDATLEIEPADRNPPLTICTGSFYLAQLVRVKPQKGDHWLLAGMTMLKVPENRVLLNPYDSMTHLSRDGAVKVGGWSLIEMERKVDNSMRVWVNEVDWTASPAPSSKTKRPFSIQNFCRGKSCDKKISEFQGAAAMMFYRCGPPLTSKEKTKFRAYMQNTYRYLPSRK